MIDTRDFLIPQAPADAADALEAIFDVHGAKGYAFPSARYRSTRPIPVWAGSSVHGVGVSQGGEAGTVFEIHPDADPADWAGRGFFTSREFLDDLVSDDLLETTSFRNFQVDGGGLPFGGGILLAATRQPQLTDVRFRNMGGAEPMPERGSGVAKDRGSFCVCLTTFTRTGRRASRADNPVDPYMENLRATKSNCPLLWTDDEGGNTITDGRMVWGNPLVQDVMQLIEGQGVIDVAHAGGWHLEFPHLNGAGGDGIVLRNCMATIVQGGWLDGFGCAGEPGDYACIRATTTSGGPASNTSLAVLGNTFRWREEQATPGARYVTLDLSVGDRQAVLDYSGNHGFVQSADVLEAAVLNADVGAGGFLLAVGAGNGFMGGDGRPLGRFWLDGPPDPDRSLVAFAATVPAP